MYLWTGLAHLPLPGHVVVALAAAGVPPVGAVRDVQVVFGVPRARQGKVGERQGGEVLATDVVGGVSLGGPQDAADPVLEAVVLLLSY